MSKYQLVLVRAFPTDVVQTGPRQLTGRLVPYDEPTDVADELPDGSFDRYREGFRLGAFSPQVGGGRGIAARVGLIHRHGVGLGYLGPFSALREEPDGLYGDVSILRSRSSDVEDLLGEGIDGLSIEFRVPTRGGTEVDDGGVRWRTRAHLDQVALEPKGAYESAQVLAFRAQADEADEAARQEEAKQATADAAAARRARWQELADRFEGEKKRQEDLVRQYGVTQPGGFRRL